MLIRCCARIDYGFGLVLLMDCWLRNVRVHNIFHNSGTNGMRLRWGVNTVVCYLSLILFHAKSNK